MNVSFLDTESVRAELQNAFDFAEKQVAALVEKYPADYYPMYTVGGQFGHDQKRWTHWCDGFYPGLMFLFAEQKQDEKWLERAVERARPLESRQYDRAVHDLGFLFFSTHLRWLDLGGPEDEIQPLLMQAGRTMAMRFQERGQYLRSFVEPASLFIDIMMNVGTIFHAAFALQDEHLLDIAHRHCETTRRVLVRGDGSTAHEAIFDLGTRRMSAPIDASGLSWRFVLESRSGVVALWFHALVSAKWRRRVSRNRATERRLLPQSTRPLTGITPWDYDAPDSGPLAKSQVDTSAAAIAASGLLDLADVTANPTQARAYRDFAFTSLLNLSRKYLGTQTPNFEGILERWRLSHSQKSRRP